HLRRPPTSTPFPYTTLFRSGLVQRGTDCTLEATILLNQSLETILAGLANESERETVSLLFNAIGAKLDKQATYHAARVYRETRRSEEHTSELQSPYDLVCRL